VITALVVTAALVIAIVSTLRTSTPAIPKAPVEVAQPTATEHADSINNTPQQSTTPETGASTVDRMRRSSRTHSYEPRPSAETGRPHNAGATPIASQPKSSVVDRKSNDGNPVVVSPPVTVNGKTSTSK
jgi:hypothetical protein